MDSIEHSLLPPPSNAPTPMAFGPQARSPWTLTPRGGRMTGGGAEQSARPTALGDFSLPAEPQALPAEPPEPQRVAALFPHYSDVTAKPPMCSASQGSQAAAERMCLPEAVRSRMETSFGQSFAEVSILANSTVAQQHGAQAVTMGHEIHFASGEFDPNSASGWHLIGHELAHVAQQRGQGYQVLPAGQSPERWGAATQSASFMDWEAEAEAQGLMAAQGQNIASQGSRLQTAQACPSVQCRKPGSNPASSSGGSGPTDPPASANEPDSDPQRSTWQQELGHFVGDKLYSLIAENLEAEDLEKYVKSGFDAVLDSALAKLKKAQATASGTPPGSLPRQVADAQSAQVSDQLKKAMKEAADKFAHSATMQRVFHGIEHAVKAHPKETVALLSVLLMGAAGLAYLTNWNPPNIAPSIDVGKSGVSIKPSLDLGPLQDVLHLRRRAIEALGLEVSLKTKVVEASLGIEYKNETEGLLDKTFLELGTTQLNGKVALNLGGDDQVRLEGMLTLDPGGKLAKLRLAPEWQHKIPGEFLGARNSTLKLQMGFEKGFGNQNGMAGDIKLSLGNEVLQFGAQYQLKQLPTLQGGGVQHQVQLKLEIHF